MELPDYNSDRRSSSPFRELQLVICRVGKVPAVLLDNSTAKNLYQKEQIGFFKRVKGAESSHYEKIDFKTAVLITTVYGVEAWGKYRSTLSLSSSGPFAVFDISNEKIAHGELSFDDANRTLCVGGVALPGAKRQQYLIFSIAGEEKPIIIAANSTLLQAIHLSVKKLYMDNNKKTPKFFWPSMLSAPKQRWVFTQKTGADGLPVFVPIDSEGNRANDKGDAYFMPHLIAEYYGDKLPGAEEVFERVQKIFAI